MGRKPDALLGLVARLGIAAGELRPAKQHIADPLVHGVGDLKVVASQIRIEPLLVSISQMGRRLARCDGVAG